MDSTVAVLTIGDELLNGELADTNTRQIALSLAGRGYALRESLTVGDIEADIAEALRHLAARCDLVIVTGGLGPTGDDLTSRVAAHAFERPLVLNEEALGQIREYFVRRGRPMHPRNEKQALLPQKVEIIPNPTGTAPGFILRHQGKELFFLPGVPSEMRVMLEESVLPQIEARLGARPPRQERVLKIFGLTEPRVEELMLQAGLPPEVELAFGVDYPMVHLKLRAAGEAAPQLLDGAESRSRSKLGDFVAATCEQTLVEEVARLLTEQGQTLSLAESCTGGQIAAMLTDIPGASAFLERGAVTYANSAKSDWLGIAPELLEHHGAVSEPTARAMARGIRRAAGSNLGLAVTGIAGPSGGTPEKPVGTVFLGLSTAQGELVKGYRFGGNRDQVRKMTVCMGLDWLRRYLSGLALPGPLQPETEKNRH